MHPKHDRMTRPLLVQRLLDQLDGLTASAGTPAGGVHVLRIEQLAVQAIEQFFDDGFLSLLLAVRNALAIENAWMAYTSEQIREIQDVIRKYADYPSNNGLLFRQAVLELEQRGVETLPFEIPSDLLTDDEE
jgi:hypothetical protein